MAIQEQLQTDLKTAMRAGEKLRVEVLRMTLAALKNTQIAQVKAAYDAAVAESGEEAAAGLDRTTPLSEEQAQSTVAKEAKRRHEAADLFRKGGRPELAEREEAEAAILEAYLPRQLTADELRPLVAAAIAETGAHSPSEMSKVMPVLMQQFKGRADGKLISQLAREVLSQAS